MHVSTVHAAARRSGEWRSLSYSHQLGYGGRKMAVAALHDSVTGFSDLCETLRESLPEPAEPRQIRQRRGRARPADRYR